MKNHLGILNKDEVSKLRFPSEDILSNSIDKVSRANSIESAVKLGNLFMHKVLILFRDDKQDFSIHTTLWGYTSDQILLKGDLYLPIHRIISITLI